VTGTLRIAAENRVEDIGRVHEAFEAFSTGHGLPSAVRRAVRIVLDDVLHNIISYAYHDDERHAIDVRVEVAPGRVSVRVADDGRPFDPLGHPAPDVTAELDDREVGGLGIHLVSRLVDEASYERSGDRNVLVLVKRFSGESEGGEAQQ